MKNRNVLVLAAHPDDEVLGCGGTIAKHAMGGDSVTVAILAEGFRSRSHVDAEKQIEKLKHNADKANKILGVKKLIFHNFPDNQMDIVPQLEVAKKIEEIIKETQPEIIYTHHASDVNVDHRKIFEGVVVAVRPQPGCKVQSVLSFEVPSSTEWQMSPYRVFEPNWFVNVSTTLEKKLQALECYESEMRPWPHARSLKAIEAQLRWRGASVGVEASEAFMLNRHIAF